MSVAQIKAAHRRMAQDPKAKKALSRKGQVHRKGGK